jgi:hypothetical protein
MNSTPKFRYNRLIALCATLGFACLASAQTSVTTTPVGAMTYSIAPGTGTSRVTTAFTIPLSDTPLAAGITKGIIASRTSTTVTVTNAGWVAGALSASTAPYQLRITSGGAAGAFLAITANTTNTLTVSGYDLSTMAAVGDGFEIIPVDTLDSLFGATTLVGGSTSASADIVYLGSNTQTGYYYNTTLGRWVLVTGLSSNKGAVQIPFSAAISISRLANIATPLTFTGTVPAVKYRSAVLNAGNTYCHSGFPADTTLGGLAINSKVAGWKTGAKATADVLSIPSGAGWTSYYHNGTNWVLVTGLATSKNAVRIIAGMPIMISKKGTASGSADFINDLPYVL